jgi:hypothetical protein
MQEGLVNSIKENFSLGSLCILEVGTADHLQKLKLFISFSKIYPLVIGCLFSILVHIYQHVFCVMS